MDGYTPFDVLMDIGWISLLLIIGNLMRRFIPWFQKLLIPAPITAGLLGLLLGPNALGIIQFSEHFGDYATILIAAVFGPCHSQWISMPRCASARERCGPIP